MQYIILNSNNGKLLSDHLSNTICKVPNFKISYVLLGVPKVSVVGILLIHTDDCLAFENINKRFGNETPNFSRGDVCVTFFCLKIVVLILIKGNLREYTAFACKTGNYFQTLSIKLKKKASPWLRKRKLINNILIPNFSFDVKSIFLYSYKWLLKYRTAGLENYAQFIAFNFICSLSKSLTVSRNILSFITFITIWN